MGRSIGLEDSEGRGQGAATCIGSIVTCTAGPRHAARKCALGPVLLHAALPFSGLLTAVQVRAVPTTVYCAMYWARARVAK